MLVHPGDEAYLASRKSDYALARSYQGFCLWLINQHKPPFNG
jgi:hypothetical protein